MSMKLIYYFFYISYTSEFLLKIICFGKKLKMFTDKNALNGNLQNKMITFLLGTVKGSMHGDFKIEILSHYSVRNLNNLWEHRLNLFYLSSSQKQRYHHRHVNSTVFTKGQIILLK